MVVFGETMKLSGLLLVSSFFSFLLPHEKEMKAQQEAPVLLHEQIPAIVCCPPKGGEKRISETQGNGGGVGVGCCGGVSGWAVDGFAGKFPGSPLVVQVVLCGGAGHQPQVLQPL